MINLHEDFSKRCNEHMERSVRWIWRRCRRSELVYQIEGGVGHWFNYRICKTSDTGKTTKSLLNYLLRNDYITKVWNKRDLNIPVQENLSSVRHTENSISLLGTEKQGSDSILQYRQRNMHTHIYSQISFS